MTTRVIISKQIQIDLPEQELWNWCFNNNIFPIGAGNDPDGNNYFEFESPNEAMIFKLACSNDFKK